MKTTRIRTSDRPRDGKREPRAKQRDIARKSERRTKHVAQGRTR